MLHQQNVYPASTQSVRQQAGNMHKHRSSVIVGTNSSVTNGGNFFGGAPTASTQIASSTIHNGLHASNSSGAATGNLLQGGSTGMANAPKKSNLGNAAALKNFSKMSSSSRHQQLFPYTTTC